MGKSRGGLEGRWGLEVPWTFVGYGFHFLKESGELSLETCHLNESLEGCEDLSYVHI